MYNLTTPMPGGSEYHIKWDDEVVTVQLPPVGYTIDRVPNLETGEPTYELVPCEILFDDRPIEEQKWSRTPLPQNWKKLSREERIRRKSDPNYVNPELDKFRQQQWTRRLNGLWIAIGNKQGRPTEYVYLTGEAYNYFNWWKQDFGFPRFRFTYLKVFYLIQWGIDHPVIHGATLSTNRRYGKTAISMHFLWEQPSRTYASKAGLQAQKREDAQAKFLENLVYGWRHQPNFFKPIYDYNSTNKNEITFAPPTPKGKANEELFDGDDETKKIALYGKIDFRETRTTSYDGYKLHRYSMEEPGKWAKVSVYTTLQKVIPSTRELFEKIGFIFAPTTIEEMEEGGEEFIRMFEDSRPSIMKKTETGSTTSQLVSLFIPAYEGVVFDEFGRSVIDDPKEGELIYDEKGKRVLKGGKTRCLELRNSKKHDYQLYVQEVRKYPFTWEEAKMMESLDGPFNIMHLDAREKAIHKMENFPYTQGNFEWVDKVDGEVEFHPDSISGRWNLNFWPDKEGPYVDGDKRITNRVTTEYFEGKPVYIPNNNRLFRIGCDPIRWTKTDDPRSSKAGAYVWYQFDPAIDLGKPKEEWKSHNFIAEYLHRPEEFEIFGEDMIKAMRYFGCSILPEENVTNLRQYLETRGYGNFLLFKRDFSDQVIRQTKEDNYKGVESNDEVVDAWVRRLITYTNKHMNRCPFPRLIEQMKRFTIKNRTKFDAVVAAGYTLLAAEANVVDPGQEDSLSLDEIFTMYDQSGTKSKRITQ